MLSKKRPDYEINKSEFVLFSGILQANKCTSQLVTLHHKLNCIENLEKNLHFDTRSHFGVSKTIQIWSFPYSFL